MNEKIKITKTPSGCYSTSLLRASAVLPKARARELADASQCVNEVCITKAILMPLRYSRIAAPKMHALRIQTQALLQVQTRALLPKMHVLLFDGESL